MHPHWRNLRLRVNAAQRAERAVPPAPGGALPTNNKNPA